MKHKGKTWVYPLCLEGRQPYGKNECDGIAVCGNTANANAHQYLDSNGHKKTVGGAKAIGIGAISNE